MTFVSEPWGEHVSYKHVTEQCGVLDKLLLGDVLLADCIFDISRVCRNDTGKAHMPAITEGKNQLSTMEIDKTRMIANVGI